MCNNDYIVRKFRINCSKQTISVQSHVTLRCMQDPRRHTPLIAGSVGPYGACQHDGSEYHGNYVDHMSSEELVKWHRPRVARLLEAGADILACETLPAKVSVALFPVLIPHV